ncbi:MAG: hypothetical protein ACI3XX_02135 [Eubacteriales bacterium]
MEATIKKDKTEITVTDKGAEPVSIKYDGKERLWQNENGSWPAHAPVLFPVCGKCKIRADGINYPCKRHGFAKDSTFTLAKQMKNSLVFRLNSNKRSMRQYPFEFVFDVIYEITDEGSLTIAYEVHNTQSKELYFSCGGHDSFALEKDVSNYELLFEKDESFDSLLVDKRGNLTGEAETIGNGKILDLSTHLLENGSSVCLDHIKSRGVILREKDGGRNIAAVWFSKSDKIILWHPEGSKMICIEPWQNLPDSKKDKDTEFPDKDGVIKVLPYGTARIDRTITYY